MKRSYLPKIIIVILLVIIIFVILNLTSFSKEIKNFFYLISQPIQRWLWSAGIKTSNLLEAIAEIKSLKKDNESLKLREQELIDELITLKGLEKENLSLRRALGLGLNKDFELIFSQIIGKETADILLIDKGSNDGLEVGFPVITEQKVLAGRVWQVYKNFSKVQLLTFKDISFDVKVFNKEVYGLVKGKGNFKLSLEFIPQKENVAVGDLTLTSSKGGVFPQNLLVGQILDVKSSDIELFQKIGVKPFLNIRDLDYLFIIKNFKK